MVGDDKQLALMAFIHKYCSGTTLTWWLLPKSVISTLIEKARISKVNLTLVNHTAMKSDTPIRQLKPIFINKDLIAIKEIWSVAAEKDLSKVELSDNDKKIVVDLALKEYDRRNSGETRNQFKQHLTNMIIAAKANNIAITKENIAAMCGIWKMEWSYQIDTKKSPQAIWSYINEITSKISMIKGLLDGYGDDYFDKKIGELEKKDLLILHKIPNHHC
jgi:hypothetical protein